MQKIILFLLVVSILLISGCSNNIFFVEKNNTIKNGLQDNTSINESLSVLPAENGCKLKANLIFKNASEEPSETKRIIDWNVFLVGCSGCSKSEIVNFKDKILLALPEGEYDFDGYSVIINRIPTKTHSLQSSSESNGIYINLTYDGYKNFNKLDLSKYGVLTVYYTEIIDKIIQIKPMTGADLRCCEEERECIKVGTSCCAGSNCGYTAINKQYVDYWAAQFNCSNVLCPGNVCMKQFSVQCLNYQCTLAEASSID